MNSPSVYPSVMTTSFVLAGIDEAPLEDDGEAGVAIEGSQQRRSALIACIAATLSVTPSAIPKLVSSACPHAR